jgi:repressor LexA
MTKTQARLLRFIKSYMDDNPGVPPSFQEMMEGLGLHSKSGIYRLMRGLRERGHIGFIDNRARSIWIIPRDDH